MSHNLRSSISLLPYKRKQSKSNEHDNDKWFIAHMTG